ncbi:extracellular solute-binding protein [Actinoplanes sichuanensis]|uniref:ABC transporter substrate-binding protein n=1 Tax=Actinoplanes sichuanensis TaxID=512349 RepID=A0ABW4APF6_9ACTN|nr:extracellular solute-binding protein [Actinoplanes sichuanensis]BEL02923.1 extracellular solute-binding protein [Actinoplanes sichuanensis]
MRSNLSRRAFLGLGATVAGGTLLSACGGGSASGSGKLKFWDMPWGQADYTAAAKRLTEAYTPVNELPGATYQEIQWANFAQTFSSAIASKTGPAVSTGGGFQAFQFAEQGAIAYADNVIEQFRKDGTFDDFLPGQIDSMKTAKGYAAVPWQLDFRVWWYRKSLLDENGIKEPTTWDELLNAGRTLAAKGVFGFGTGAGAGNNLGSQGLLLMMLNNGGGLFDPDGKVDVVTPPNLEAMRFVQELVRAKAVDPASISYTTDNLITQWKNKKVAMGIHTAGLDTDTGETDGDLRVLSPLTGPSGAKAGLVFQNNIMMYANTPSTSGSEAFLSYYIRSMKALWQQNVVAGLPVLKSIVALPEFQKQTQKAKIIAEWAPVAKTFATRSTALFGGLAAVDSSQPLTQFAQTVLAGDDPKAALDTLQGALQAIVK